MGQPDADSTGGWHDGRTAGVGMLAEDGSPPSGRRSAGRRRAPQPSMMGDIAGGARSLGQRVKRAPTRVRIAAAAGVVALAVVGAIVLTGAFSGPDDAGAAPGPSTGASGDTKTPLYAGVKKYSSRGITLNVPADWEKSEGGTYVDFIDPDAGAAARKIRINIEPAGSSAEAFFKVAEAKLKKNPDCPTYQRVGLKDIRTGGRGGSELEYTCGQGDQQRHGLWSAVVVSGKAYEFFLTVPDSDLADSKIIYDEMVRSFTLTVA
jgi:eukaryotic-like serine/threonine-protein kinase